VLLLLFLISPPSLDGHRGFAFVDFEESVDAEAAIENMNGAELYGKFIKCTIAKSSTKLQPGQAIWATEEFYSSKANPDGTETAED
jgi:RNA recognition motif-containing protein